jgi:drug/metabolite transporter (DMT)-like permease
MYLVLGWLIIIIWASMFTLIKILLNCSNGNVFLVIMMYNLTATITSIFTIYKFRKEEIDSFRALTDKKRFFVLVLLNGMYDVFLALGIFYSIQVQFAIISNYLWPMLLILFIHLIRKIKINLLTVVSLTFGFLAVVLISIPEGKIEFTGNIIGILLGVIAAFLWSGYSALMKKEHENIPTIIQGSAQIVSALLAFIITLALSKFNFGDVDNMQSLILIFSFGIVLMASNTLWIIIVVKHPDVKKVISSVYFVPILGVIIASLVFGNTVNIKVWLGLLLVILGTLVSEYEKKKINSKENSL